MPKSLVVCVGNSLVGDDRVGPEVYARLSKRSLPPDVRLHDLGIGGLDLVDELNGEDLLIIVDAVQLGGEPGHLNRVEWRDLPAPEAPGLGAHGVGLREALALCERLYPERMPARALLIGVEGRDFTQLGGELSPGVTAGIERAVDEVLRLVGPGAHSRIPKAQC